MRRGLAGRVPGLPDRRTAVSVLDWALLALVSAGVLLALRAIRRGHTGGCCGDCARCGRRCGGDRDRED